jgi:hypothetical protein
MCAFLKFREIFMIVRESGVEKFMGCLYGGGRRSEFIYFFGCNVDFCATFFWSKQDFVTI